MADPGPEVPAADPAAGERVTRTQVSQWLAEASEMANANAGTSPAYVRMATVRALTYRINAALASPPSLDGMRVTEDMIYAAVDAETAYSKMVRKRIEEGGSPGAQTERIELALRAALRGAP